MSEIIERTQSEIIRKLNHKMKEMNDEMEKKSKDKNNLIGILVGLLHQHGDAKAGIIRIRKKHMMKANPGWLLFPEIDNASKDLIVRFLDRNTIPRKKGSEACQSTTTSAKNVEKNSKPSTDPTTKLKSVPDVGDKQEESLAVSDTLKV